MLFVSQSHGCSRYELRMYYKNCVNCVAESLISLKDSSTLAADIPCKYVVYR